MAFFYRFLGTPKSPGHIRLCSQEHASGFSACWRFWAEIAAVADDLPVTIIILLESELELVGLREFTARDVVAVDLRIVLYSCAVGNLGIAGHLPVACIVALGGAGKLVRRGLDGNVRA